MPEISVIVPVYKVEKYINKCVDSILGQSFRDFDLVLVDDGSPDSCPQICDDYAAKDDRIKVIHKQNGGLSDARNAGIDWAMEHSESRWLAFVDSDDYVHPDYLKTLYDTAMKENADLVICDFVRVNEDGEDINEEHSFYDLVTEDKKELFKILNSNWRVVPAWNKLYSKNIFSELRFEFGKIHEDEFAIHHVLWNCKRAAILSSMLYFYLVRGNSIMTTETSQSKLDGFEAMIERYRFGEEKGIAAFDDGISIEYLSKLSEMKRSFDKQGKNRYRKLKKQFLRTYFDRSTNQSLRRYIGLHLFPTSYGKLGSLHGRTSKNQRS